MMIMMMMMMIMMMMMMMMRITCMTRVERLEDADLRAGVRPLASPEYCNVS